MRTLRYISYLVVLSLLFFSKTSDVFSTTSSSQPSVTITEEDLVPQGKPRVIKFSNGSLVFNLDGSASVTTGGGAMSWEDLTDSTTIDAATIDGLDTSDFIRTYDVYGTATIDASDTILFRDTITGNYYRSTVQGILDIAPGAAEINNLEVIATGILAGEVPVGSGAGVVTYRQLVLDDISDSNTIGSTISWQDLADSNTINAQTLNNYTSDDFADSQLSNVTNIDADTLDGFDSTDFADTTHATTHANGGSDVLNFGGDTTGTYNANVVGNDSHAHTATTLTMASTDLTDSNSIDADTLDGYDSSDFADSTLVGGGTLDTAYDFGGAGAGRTIIADTGAVRIDGTAGSLDINDTSTTTTALDITANTLTTGKIARFYSDTSDTVNDRDLVEIVNDRAAATYGSLLYLKQDGGRGPKGAFHLVHSGTSSGRGAVIDYSAGTASPFEVNCSTPNAVSAISVNVTNGDSNGITIVSSATSNGPLAIYSDVTIGSAVAVTASSLTSGRLFIGSSNSASTTARKLFGIYNLNASSTQATVADFEQYGSGTCIRAYSDTPATVESTFSIYGYQTTGDTASIASQGLTTGKGLKVFSQSSSNSEHYICHLYNAHADADQAYPLYIQNLGADYYIYASNGAYLSNAGTWTNAPSTITDKEDVVEVTPTGYADKLKAMKLYKYKKKVDIYGAKEDLLESTGTELSDEEGKKKYDKAKAEKFKEGNDYYVVNKESGKYIQYKVIGYGYNTDKRNVQGRNKNQCPEYMGYILDDPTTPDELVAKDDIDNPNAVTGVPLDANINFLHAVIKELIARIEVLEAQ